MSRIPKTFLSPAQIFSNHKGFLNKVYGQTQDLLAIQSVVRNFVPDSVFVASFSNEILHLTTNSSAAATQIRYRQRNIISAVRRTASQYEVTSIKVSVRPEAPKYNPPSIEPTPPSPSNAQLLADTAQYIEDDALRKALIKLSKRGI